MLAQGANTGALMEEQQVAKKQGRKEKKTQPVAEVSENTEAESGTTEEVKKPGRRGKRSRFESQIAEAVSRHQAGSAEPVTITLDNEEGAKKAKINLYTTFRNHGLKADLALNGNQVSVVVTGVFEVKKKEKAGGRKSKGGSSGVILVRFRKGKGWAYQEFSSSSEANDYIQSAKAEVEAFQQIPLETRTVKTLGI